MRVLNLNLFPSEQELEALKAEPHVSGDEGQDLGLIYQARAMASGAPAVLLRFTLVEADEVVLCRLSASMLLTAAAAVQARAERDGLVNYAKIQEGSLEHKLVRIESVSEFSDPLESIRTIAGSESDFGWQAVGVMESRRTRSLYLILERVKPVPEEKA